MMPAAARTLGANSPALKNPAVSLLPPLTAIRRVAAEIAIAVGMQGQKDALAPKLAEDELTPASDEDAVDARLRSIGTGGDR